MPEVLLAALVAVAYLGATVRARRWPARRTAAFLAGAAVLAAALGPPLDGPADARLSAHTVQHLLLVLVVAPLLVAGGPITLALRTLGSGGRWALAGLLRARAVRALTHPAVALALLWAATVGTHVPAVQDAAHAHPALHALEHAVLLWTALLFWLPLLGPAPVPHTVGVVGRLVLLLLSMAPMTFVGAWLAEAGTEAYAGYRGGLADQQVAGGVMWMGGMLFVLPALLVCAWSALSAEERRQRVREAAR